MGWVAFAPIAVAVAVVGIGAYALTRTPAPVASTTGATAASATADSRQDTATPIAQPPKVSQAASAVASTVAAVPKRSRVADAESFFPSKAPSKPGSATSGSPQSRAKLVAAQLAAGEFGPALVTAQSVADAGERSTLLKSVADAQAKLGDFHAADQSIRRMPVPEKREQAHAENSARRTAAGGGANPQPLIMLIKNVTGTEEDWTEDQRKMPQWWAPGVEVDPNGLLRTLSREEKGTRLAGLGHEAREADLNTDMRTQSPLRLVSLTRLEKEVAKLLAAGRSIPETMQHLAGLSHVQYVFVYPDQHEVVIAGPAEGWKYNETGLAVGKEGGRPTLYLDDFVTVLRTFAPHGPGFFNCLILPRQAGLKAIKEFVAESNARGPLEPHAVRNWTAQLQQKLGLQDIQINGIPDDSRVAQVIVEADYKMKLIGVGKLNGGPEIPSYFDLLPKTGQLKGQPMDALRWWLSMKYDAVMHSPDRNVFEIQGSAVLCQSENEKISARGQRIHTGQSEATNRLFAANFTEHYSELAKRDPVFGDVQNIFDLSLVAALLTDNRVPERAGWELGAFGPNGAYQTAHFQPPKTVLSVVNHRVYHGTDIVVQVAGGVDGQLHRVLADKKVFRNSAELASLKATGRAPRLPEGRWWWDAKR